MGMSANQKQLLRSDRDGVATLTMNRSGTRNALSADLIANLQAEFREIASNANIRVVVLSANGPVYCSGHDLNEIRQNQNQAAYEELFTECSKLMLMITKLPQPVIARVQGTATAAGCQLVATCDLAVASEKAAFATPGVNIGLFCSTPMVALSRNIGRKQAMEMLLTGDVIDAENAQNIGLINKVCPEKELDEIINNWCSNLKSKSPLTIKIGKDAFYQQIDLALEEAYDFASGVMVNNMMTMDAAEGIDAFLEKRQPVWKGK